MKDSSALDLNEFHDHMLIKLWKNRVYMYTKKMKYSFLFWYGIESTKELMKYERTLFCQLQITYFSLLLERWRVLLAWLGLTIN